MYPPVRPLEERSGKYLLNALVTVISRSQAITVSDHAAKPVIFPDDGRAMQFDSQLFFKVAKGPHVVVACMIMDGNSSI